MHAVVVFMLEGQRIGLPLSAVDRAVRAVALTYIPKAPPIVCGLVNVHGRVVPVVDTRRRFRLSQREIALDDHLLLAHTTKRPLAMWVDTVTGVVPYEERDMVPAETVVPGMEYVQGIVKLPDGMVLIHDLDTFLSLEERQALDEALGNA